MRPAGKARVAVSKAPSKPVAKGTVSSLRVKALEKMLIARRQEVIKEIEGLMSRRMSDEMQGRIDSAPDVGDQALLDSERGRDISILEMRNRVRQQIEEALARLWEGPGALPTPAELEDPVGWAARVLL